jgi:cytochrome c
MDPRSRAYATADWHRLHCLRLVAAILILALLGAGSSQAAGDAAKGKAAFNRQCAICHTVARDGANLYGPNLFGIIEAKAGAVAGFNYSRAFRAAASWTWNPDLIGGWITYPNLMVRGTTMGVFQGAAEKDRDDIVAYLATLR